MSQISPGALDLGRWLPEHLLLAWDLEHPSAWVEHAPFMAWLVGEHRPGTFVELGSHWGFSYFAAIRTAEALGLQMDALAVDTWEGDAHAGEYGEDVYEYVRARSGQGAVHSRLFRGYFDDALATVADGSVDLLHIDGLHTYEASSHDYQNWLSKMSARGIILFHDTCEHAGDFGVFRTWAEASAQYPSFEFTHGHGLGVLLVGTNVGPGVSELAASSGTEQGAAVRRLFQALGSDVAWEGSLRAVTTALNATLAGGPSREGVIACDLGLAEPLRPLLVRQAELLDDRDRTHVALAQAQAAHVRAVEEAKHAVHEARSREQALSAQRDELAGQLADVVNSRSWRLTSGLRAVGRVVRDPRRALKT